MMYDINLYVYLLYIYIHTYICVCVCEYIPIGRVWRLTVLLDGKMAWAWQLAFTRYSFTSRLLRTNQNQPSPPPPPPPPICIAHPGAIRLHDYWAVFDYSNSPPIARLSALQHTLKVITISFKGVKANLGHRVGQGSAWGTLGESAPVVSLGLVGRGWRTVFLTTVMEPCHREVKPTHKEPQPDTSGGHDTRESAKRPCW